MQVRQSRLPPRSGDSDELALAPLQAIEPQLILCFGSPARLADATLHERLRRLFPDGHLAGCSTAGEIGHTDVQDHSLTVTALHFDHTRICQASAPLARMADSEACGAFLGRQLAAPDLRAVLVLAQGVSINGSALVRGLSSQVAKGVSISGGLAGDGGAFKATWVLDDQGISPDRVVALGLYGEHLQVSHGSMGGWRAFGPLRKVTRSTDNVLFELDNEPALTVYKRYLAQDAARLPSSGLRYPFEMVSNPNSGRGVIRTLLGIDEITGSLILAGEITPGSYLRLMHSDTSDLVSGASRAADQAHDTCPEAQFALLVSCVGRKLVMGERVEEEVEAVASVLGHQCLLAGFYSYGEISPQNGSAACCELHNQTMTITCFAETQP